MTIGQGVLHQPCRRFRSERVISFRAKPIRSGGRPVSRDPPTSAARGLHRANHTATRLFCTTDANWHVIHHAGTPNRLRQSCW